MGLDMYAVRKLDVKQWDFQPRDERYSVKIECGGNPVPGINLERISGVEEDVMYWRKANHIHAWFVNNVQDGEDDCGSYIVPYDKIRDLLNVCNKVITSCELIEGSVHTRTVYDKEHA